MQPTKDTACHAPQTRRDKLEQARLPTRGPRPPSPRRWPRVFKSASWAGPRRARRRLHLHGGRGGLPAPGGQGAVPVPAAARRLAGRADLLGGLRR
jgi:hypothetical protein